MNREKIIEEIGSVLLQCYGQGEIVWNSNLGRKIDEVLSQQKKELLEEFRQKLENTEAYNVLIDRVVEKIKEEQYTCIMLKNIDWDDRKIIRNFLNEFYEENKHS